MWLLWLVFSASLVNFTLAIREPQSKVSEYHRQELSHTSTTSRAFSGGWRCTLEFEEGEECLSVYGWRGSCKTGWDCPNLAQLVSGGYQLELCTTSADLNRGETRVCCPNTHLVDLPAGIPAGIPWSQATANFDYNPPEISFPLNNGISFLRPAPQGPSSLLKPKKRRRHPPGYLPYLRTYIQDEDGNTIIKITPIRAPLNRIKRKPFTKHFRGIQKTLTRADHAQDLSVQDEQLSFAFEKPQRKATEHCEEYAAAFGSLSLLKGPTSPELCPGNLRVSTVEPAEFPFMVGLGYEDARGELFWACSGTLISKDYVLTAAHCLHPPLGRPKVARLGTSHLDVRRIGLDTGIKEVLLHPLYSPSDRAADLALLRLTGPAFRHPGTSPKIRPACLSVRNTSSSVTDNRPLLLSPYWAKDLTVTMNMKRDDEEVPEPESLTLRKTISVEVSRTNCNLSTSDSDYLCLDAVSTFNCQSGSEGGEPLIQRDETTPCLYQVIGVAVDKACAPSQATVFTRIDPFISWIENIVWP